MPFCQVILSVSGSAARKNTFFLPANSVTARPTLERNVPERMLTPSRGDELLGDAHGVARIGAVVARDHLELLAEHAAGALISSTAISQPFLYGSRKAGCAL